MKSKWLINKNRKKLVLFFAGWGMDENPFLHMTCEEADVMMIYHYSNRNLPVSLTDICAEYDSVIVVAWSLGAAVAEAVCDEHRFHPDRAIAVNGTTCPADDRYGIPEALFNGTIESMSDDNLKRFYRRMCRETEVFDFFLRHAPDLGVTELKAELKILRDFPPSEGTMYNRAFICMGDRIIPPENQLRCWDRAKVQAIEIPGPHYPFYTISEWEELINE